MKFEVIIMSKRRENISLTRKCICIIATLLIASLTFVSCNGTTPEVETDATPTTEIQTNAPEESSVETATVATTVEETTVEETSVEETTTVATTVEETTIEETTIEETSVEETSVEETTLEETSVEETSIEETSVEETSVEETSVEETSIEETSVEDTTVEDTSAEETSVEETSIEETSVEETSVEETTIEETSVEETSVEETSVEETTIEETSVEETSVEETSVEETTTEEVTTEEVTTEEVTTEEVTTEEVTTEEVTTINPDIYKNETKLFARSVMFSAIELEGEFDSLMFKDGGLVLIEGATAGTFISGEVNMGGSFKKMVTSWNATSTGGTVEVSVAIKLDDGSFTDWYSWGEWTAIRGNSGSKTKEDSNGKINVDILTLNNECQGIIKFKIDIKQTTDHSPILHNVTFACNKADSSLTFTETEAVKLDVPYRRQQDVPEIGGSICSATSLSMVMLYHGEEIEGTDGIADVAWGVRDYGAEIFGNWAFNVAYAGELGYNTYVDFFDVDDIKYAVSTGHPIVCSIKVTRGQLAASGFRGYTTNGHLICIVGYEVRDGQMWLLVNDPAHPEVTALLESDFVNVYRGVSYIVQTRPEVNIAE